MGLLSRREVASLTTGDIWVRSVFIFVKLKKGHGFYCYYVEIFWLDDDLLSEYYDRLILCCSLLRSTATKYQFETGARTCRFGEHVRSCSFGKETKIWLSNHMFIYNNDKEKTKTALDKVLKKRSNSIRSNL